MNHAPASEVFVEFLVVGDIIPMREKHQRNAAQFLDAPNQRSRESGRINQDIPLRTRNEVRRCAVRIGRCEAAKMDVLIDYFGISGRSSPRIELASRSDRTGWASHKSHGGSVLR